MFTEHCLANQIYSIRTHRRMTGDFLSAAHQIKIDANKFAYLVKYSNNRLHHLRALRRFLK